MFKATTLTNSLRSTTTTFAPSLTRSFHASSPTMAIKTYFDVQWTGPKVNANGSVTYTPTSGFSGIDELTYTVDDGGLITNLRGYWNMDAMTFGQQDAD